MSLTNFARAGINRKASLNSPVESGEGALYDKNKRGSEIFLRFNKRDKSVNIDNE